MELRRSRISGHPFVVFAVLLNLLVLTDSGAVAAFKNLKTGDAALPLAGRDLDGKDRSLKELADAKASVVFFWATWSERAVRQMEDLVRLEKAYGDKGLKVLAVNVEKQDIGPEALDAIRKVVSEKTVAFPVLVDQGLGVYNEWGVMVVPTTALLDSGGTIVFEISSYPTGADEELEREVKKLLGLAVPAEEKPAAQAGYQPAGEALRRFGLGKRLLSLGFRDKAIPELQKAAEADTHYPEPPLYLGFARIAEVETGPAEADLGKAAALAPGRPEPVLLLAHLFLARGQLDKARALLEGKEAALGLALEGGGTPASATPEALAAAVKARLGDLGFALESGKKISPQERLKKMMEGKEPVP